MNLKWQLPEKIWLASRSPRRKSLLEGVGIQADIFLAQDEARAELLETALEDEAPTDYVARVTRLKLLAALDGLHACSKEGIVLAADTTVALQHRILGKPGDATEAKAMLESLSGKTHWVHTAVAVAKLESNNFDKAVQSIALKVQTSEVRFTTIPDAFIERYVAQGEPFDKAGGYGIQGSAAQFVEKISGSHTGIMGLPLFETCELLRHVRHSP